MYSYLFTSNSITGNEKMRVREIRYANPSMFCRCIMAKSKKVAKKTSGNKSLFTSNMRFIVPMPGRSTFARQSTQFTLKKFHRVTNKTEDLAIEDFKVQFLMQREYPID